MFKKKIFLKKILSYNILNKMSTTANFRIDPNQYLGEFNSQYRDELYSLALSNPTKYFKFRKEASKYIREEGLKNIYHVIYDALNTGTKSAGGRSTGVPIGPHMPDGGPRLSEKHINQIALSASETLNKIFDEIMSQIAPLDYKEIANSRLKIHGENNQINTGL